MNKKGKIIGLSLVAIMVVSLFAVAIPSVAAQDGDKPDLVITNIWINADRIHYTIQNIGDAAAPTSYTGLWVDDHYSARDRVDPLAPDEESDEVFARENYKGGEIVVCADYQGRIEEEDEENNCRGGLPDLVIIDKYETVDPETCEFMVHFKVCNVADGDADASVACVYIDGGEPVDEVPVEPLAAGECTAEITVGPYECIPCEILTIGVEADNYDEVDECDEENNILENEFHCPAPDLEITGKEETVNPEDCTFTVTFTVNNIGNCKAGASVACVYSAHYASS
jgi:subtilase family serine protease